MWQSKKKKKNFSQHFSLKLQPATTIGRKKKKTTKNATAKLFAMILSVALCEMCQCYSTDGIIPLIPGQWQADWLMSNLGPLGPGPVAADGWERLKGWWWWWGRGASEEAKGVEGERACETLEFIPKLMARDRLQVTPPHSSPPSHPHPQRRRRDQQVGWAL